MMPRSFTLCLGMSPRATASSTPLAIAACTVPIRMLVYLLLFTVTLLTMSVTGRICTSLLKMANTRVCPFTWSPSKLAMAYPTGPSSSPMTTSGSAADHASSASTSASPVRSTIRSFLAALVGLEFFFFAIPCPLLVCILPRPGTPGREGSTGLTRPLTLTLSPEDRGEGTGIHGVRLLLCVEWNAGGLSLRIDPHERPSAGIDDQQVFRLPRHANWA